MYSDMKGKSVIITGGSMGIGKGCVKVFSDAGANVVFGARGKEAGMATEREVNSASEGTCRFYPCDVTKPEEIRAMVEYTAEKLGGIDCIVNNAGYTPPRKPIDEIEVEDFLDLLKTNLVSVFAGCKYALPYIRSRKGSVINIGSILGTVGQEGASIYTATKGGITSFTKTLAIDEARNQVRVNAVLPGNITTEKIEKKRQEQSQPQQFTASDVQWLGDGGLPRDIGNACLFLASSQAGFMTGAVVHVTGGYELASGYKVIRQNWENSMKFK